MKSSRTIKAHLMTCLLVILSLSGCKNISGDPDDKITSDISKISEVTETVQNEMPESSVSEPSYLTDSEEYEPDLSGCDKPEGFYLYDLSDVSEMY